MARNLFSGAAANASANASAKGGAKGSSKPKRKGRPAPRMTKLRREALAQLAAKTQPQTQPQGEADTQEAVRVPFLPFQGPRLPWSLSLDLEAVRRCPRRSPVDLAAVREQRKEDLLQSDPDGLRYYNLHNAVGFGDPWDAPCPQEVESFILREKAFKAWDGKRPVKPTPIPIPPYRPTLVGSYTVLELQTDRENSELGPELRQLRRKRDSPNFAIWKRWAKKGRAIFREAQIEAAAAGAEHPFAVALEAAYAYLCPEWFQHEYECAEDDVHALEDFTWCDGFESFRCDEALDPIGWDYVGFELMVTTDETYKALSRAITNQNMPLMQKLGAEYDALGEQFNERKDWRPHVIDKTKPIGPGNIRWGPVADPCNTPNVLYPDTRRHARCQKKHVQRLVDGLGPFLDSTGMDGLRLLAYLKAKDCRGQSRDDAEGRENYPGWSGVALHLAHDAGVQIDTVLRLARTTKVVCNGTAAFSDEETSGIVHGDPYAPDAHVDFVLRWASNRWDEVFPAGALDAVHHAGHAGEAAEQLMAQLRTSPALPGDASLNDLAVDWIAETRPVDAVHTLKTKGCFPIEDRLRELLLDYPPSTELQQRIDLLGAIARQVDDYQTLCGRAYRLRLRNQDYDDGWRKEWGKALKRHNKALELETEAFAIRDHINDALPFLCDDPEAVLRAAVHLRHIEFAPEPLLATEMRRGSFDALRGDGPEAWAEMLVREERCLARIKADREEEERIAEEKRKEFRRLKALKAQGAVPET